MRKCRLTFILFFTCGVFGQSEAKLFEEFGPLPCEHLSAITDSFFQRLSDDPTSRAFVVINPAVGKMKQAEMRRKLIYSRFQFQKAENRITFVFGAEKPSIETRYWIVNVGEVAPKIVGRKWTEPPMDLTKPFIFGYEDENGICPTFVPRLYANLLLGNRHAKSHIVIYGETSADRRTFARNWLDTFNQDFGVSRNRFRLFFVKQKGITNGEFWFVP